jgi:hypothetical protein
MKHTPNELLDIVYRYYPRSIGATAQLDTTHRKETEEHARLVAARHVAAADERWPAMLRRISERFPEMLVNQSLHLPTGNHDACYSFTIDLPKAAGGRTLWFLVGFLAPYYINYSRHLVDVVKQPEGFRFTVHGLPFYIPRGAIGLKLRPELNDEGMSSVTFKREHISFDLTPDEQPYAEWIARDIKATFGCELMPPEVGTMLVPDVNLGGLGPVRLYDCLFSDSHQWVEPEPSEEMIRTEIDASSFADTLTAVLTVLAALYHIGLALAPSEVQSGYFRARTDGVLHKEEMLQALARMRLHVETPTTLRAMVAAHELEALIAAWEGEGAPSHAMVAWASSFLAERPPPV